MTSKYKVVISCNGNDVVFEASSPVSESRSADYNGYDITHLPTNIFAYRSTSGRHFGVSGKLVSRNKDEAQQNARYVDLIRKWVLPDFGATGATPPIVKLSAYANNNISRVNCVIKTYSFSFPDDVDYIFTSDPPMPIIMMLDIQLEEAYSPLEITNGAWRLKTAARGSFVYGQAGGSYNWKTTDNFGGKTVLPNIADASGNSFGGIANEQMCGPMQTAGSIIGDLSVNGGTTSSFGVTSSSTITEPNISSSLKNLQFVNGVDPATYGSNATASPSLNTMINQSTTQTSDLFGRNTGLTNKLPTFANQ